MSAYVIVRPIWRRFLARYLKHKVTFGDLCRGTSHTTTGDLD